MHRPSSTLQQPQSPSGVEVPLMAALSKEAVRRQVLAFLDEEPEDGDNLMDFGLSSIDAMQLIAAWKEVGFDVSFVELARRPTIDGMWELLRARASAGPKRLTNGS
ncbi:phosphopantetheine-binding protein [Rhizobium sp. TRM95111]|uniref:phosphopantetheine-binding protein n=1 Tax=Rhizobium alarense TaxID=2846851 RepID=UPI001F237949|nr:phosphopantetheine-binding protein [Rhizobium alarense]MCF3639294.1 phosphopantetheine-binding protein [Rhizobium alarense]